MVASGSGCASGDRYERGRCRQSDRGRRCGRRAHGAADLGAPCRGARRGGGLAQDPDHGLDRPHRVGARRHFQAPISADVPAAGSDTLRNPRRGPALRASLRRYRRLEAAADLTRHVRSEGVWRRGNWLCAGRRRTRRSPARLEGQRNQHRARGYHLKLTLPSGQVRDDWLDAESFLERRYDRVTRNAVGATGIVSVYLRNYQTVNGLVMPLLIETGRPASRDTDKMIVEKIALNPTFDNAQFTRPTVPSARRHGAMVNTQSPPANSPPGHGRERR